MASRERVVEFAVKARDEYSKVLRNLEQQQKRLSASAAAQGRRAVVGVAKGEIETAVANYKRLNSEVDRYRAVQANAARTGSLSAAEMRELGDTIKLVRDRSREAMGALQQKRAALQQINGEARVGFASFSRLATEMQRGAVASTNESVSLVNTTAELNKLTTASKKAAAAQGSLGDRMDSVANAGGGAKKGSRAGGDPEDILVYGLRPWQLTNLGYQVNDVVSGLAMGQAPLQVLAQQAGQFAQIWPNVMVSVARSIPQLAMLGVVLAPFISAAMRLKEAGDSVEYFQKKLALSADGYRYTAEGLTEITDKIKDMGVSIDDARSLVAGFASDGISGGRFAGLADLAKNLDAVTGEGVVEAGRRVSAAFRGSVDDVRALDQELNFLTASQYEQIKAMDASGNRAGALAMAQDVLRTKLEGTKTEASDWAKAINEMRAAWDELVGALEDSGIIQFVTREINYFGRDVKNFTRDIRAATKVVQGAFEDQSVGDRISELRQAIALEEKLREGGISTGSMGMTGVDNLAEMKTELNDLLGLQREIAKVERERNVETAAMSRESEAQRKAQTDINAAVEKGLDSMREEASAVTLTNRERFIEEKLLKARNDALEQAKKLNQEFLGLTKEQTEAIRQQAGALYDAQNRNFEAQYTAERGTPQGRQMEELIAATVKLAEQMGVSAKDLLTAMSYETGGTFDPWKAGPTTQNGQHRGLIQWGEPQAARYGVTGESTISQQIEAVGKYLADAGVKAGDGLLQIYAAINAGNAKNINASDAKNGGAPGTVLDKVSEQMGGHEARAQGLLAAYAGTVEHATKLAQFDKDRALDQQEYLTDYQKRVEQQKFELDLMSKSAREAAILKAVRDEENRARETGLQLTKEQRAETERLAAEEFDRSNVNREVNELLEQRSLLLERMDLAQSSGDQSLFASTATELDNVNTKLNEAIASAIAFWQAMGGEGAANAISQLQNMQITIGQSTDRMKTQFLPTAEDINEKLADIGGNAFSAFAQAIANGENAADAFFNALLQGISEFLIEIGKAIIKQALFNALTGGTSSGAGAGGGIGGLLSGLFGAKHSGGMVGATTQTRRVNPMVFAGAQRYHGGGIVTDGLRQGEVPIVALEGEEVLTENDPRHSANGGGGKAVNLKVVNAFNPEEVLEAALSSVAGERILTNWMSRNQNKVNGALGR